MTAYILKGHGIKNANLMVTNILIGTNLTAMHVTQIILYSWLLFSLLLSKEIYTQYNRPYMERGERDQTVFLGTFKIWSIVE